MKEQRDLGAKKQLLSQNLVHLCKTLSESGWIQTWTMAIHIEVSEWSSGPGLHGLKLVCEVKKISHPHSSYMLVKTISGFWGYFMDKEAPSNIPDFPEVFIFFLLLDDGALCCLWSNLPTSCRPLTVRLCSGISQLHSLRGGARHSSPAPLCVCVHV